MLIDTIPQIIAIPEDKILKAECLIDEILANKKTTVHKLQSLCGFLNFLGRSVVPGKAFTRYIYSGKGPPNSNSIITSEFLGNSNQTFSCGRNSFGTLLFLAENLSTVPHILPLNSSFFTDALKSIGFGGYCENEWMYDTWNSDFIQNFNPSIGYLELYAVTAAILNWIHKFSNMSIILFCDNKSAVDMINSNSSSCKHCLQIFCPEVKFKLSKNWPHNMVWCSNHSLQISLQKSGQWKNFGLIRLISYGTIAERLHRKENSSNTSAISTRRMQLILDRLCNLGNR